MGNDLRTVGLESLRAAALQTSALPRRVRARNPVMRLATFNACGTNEAARRDRVLSLLAASSWGVVCIQDAWGRSEERAEISQAAQDRGFSTVQQKEGGLW